MSKIQIISTYTRPDHIWGEPKTSALIHHPNSNDRLDFIVVRDYEPKCWEFCEYFATADEALERFQKLMNNSVRKGWLK